MAMVTVIEPSSGKQITVNETTPGLLGSLGYKYANASPAPAPAPAPAPKPTSAPKPKPAPTPAPAPQPTYSPAPTPQTGPSMPWIDPGMGIPAPQAMSSWGITKPLDPGMTDSQVRLLQQFLNSQGYAVAAQGQPGSPGNETDYFGPSTMKALQRYQATNGIINYGDPSTTGYGRVGPSTLAKINGTSTGGLQASPQQPGSTPVQPSAAAPGAIDPNTGAPLSQGGTPYFMGDYSLVRFSGQGPSGGINEGVVWLLDKQTKTLRPFTNEAALNSFFSTPIDVTKIPVMQASALMPGGILGSQNGVPGYELLGSEYAVQPNGMARALDYSSSQLAVRYGQQINNSGEQYASMLVDGFLDSLAKTDAGIGRNTLNSLKNDSTRISFYINAMAYGGYTLPDIYRDIKARELGLDEVRPISIATPRVDYSNTQEGQFAYSDARTAPPAQIGNMSTSSLNLSLYDLPDEAFKTLIPVLDYNSDEFKQKMNDIESAYHDILLQQINAGTEQEKALADYNWERFREELSTNYGIQLSNNALDAWNQIEQAYDQFAQRNISGSGLQNEAIDDYLRRVRLGDQRLREESLSKEETEQMKFYTGYATSQQVKDLIAEDQAKGLPQDQWRATRWGLVPSTDISSTLSLSALKAKYPNESDETLQRYITSVLDENGNYRSSLFQRQMASKLDVESSKRQYQQGMVLEQSLRDEEKASKEFTTPDSPFLRTISNENTNVQPYLPPNATTPQNTDIASQVRQAAQTQYPPSIQQTPNIASTVQSTISRASTPPAPATTIKSPTTGLVSNPVPVSTTSTKPTTSTIPSLLMTPKPSTAPINFSAVNIAKPAATKPAPIITTKTSTPAVAPKQTGGNIITNAWNKLTSFF